MYIVTGSVTSALRLAKEIENYSAKPCSVVHTPMQLRKKGCSYSIKTDVNDFSLIREMAAETGTSIKGFYEEKYENGGRVYYDIS